MNYGMYVSASAAAAQMARQDVFSNNMANANTVGFKPDMLGLRHREAARIEDHLYHLPSNAMLEKLGAGVMPMPTRVSTSQGTIRVTDNPLDVAIRGEGFLQVESDPRTSGGTGFVLTRDGRMTIGREGLLVRVTDGAAVLDIGGRRISVDPSLPVEIDESGVIRQGGAEVAQLGIVGVPDASRLTKRANASFALGPAFTGNQLVLASGRVEQGSVEEAAVDPIKAMLAVQGAARAAQGNLRMASTIYDVMGNAISRLGRVS